ncbi:MAG: pantoate--beta-alanine ligase [Cohaesibacter sp.]|nr:pantoate--beta-alanine ligase [Cohaesibacter sp.]
MTGTPPLTIARTITDLRTITKNWRQKGETFAMVPTMGALHAGHLSLVEQAQTLADHVIVSIFVNPTQFAPNEDFDAYPRTEQEDCAKLANYRIGAVFCPSAREMYPDGFCTHVTLDGPAKGLESDFRPHFFQGVATVVTKLLLAAHPDLAIFGEKDFQQLRVIQRFAKDLNIPTQILGGPTMREADGLAMSSRNAYLSVDERAQAVKLITIMRQTANRLQKGDLCKAALEDGMQALKEAGFTPDYLSLHESHDLATFKGASLTQEQIGQFRLLAAVWLGKTRLIDNIEV